MTNSLALALALLVLATTLGIAVVRPPHLSEALAASVGAVLLVVVGAAGLRTASEALRDLGPTVGFLAAILLIADGCRREGLFDAMGAVMARGSGGSPVRLLAFAFVIAAAITAVLRLDAAIVLLTPVVLATAARMLCGNSLRPPKPRTPRSVLGPAARRFPRPLACLASATFGPAASVTCQIAVTALGQHVLI